MTVFIIVRLAVKPAATNLPINNRVLLQLNVVGRLVAEQIATAGRELLRG
jgi:hypothetical protein